MEKERVLDKQGVIAYSAIMHCRNCCEQEPVKIPTGITKLQFRKGRLCPNCGCKMDGGE